MLSFFRPDARTDGLTDGLTDRVTDRQTGVLCALSLSIPEPLFSLQRALWKFKSPRGWAQLFQTSLQHALWKFRSPRGWAHSFSSLSLRQLAARASRSGAAGAHPLRRRGPAPPRAPRLYYYYTILYYTILYYTILYHTILYYTTLYYTILYYTIVSLNMLSKVPNIGT